MYLSHPRLQKLENVIGFLDDFKKNSEFLGVAKIYKLITREQYKNVT